MTTHRLNKIFALLLIAVSAVLWLTGCQINGKVIGMSNYYYDDSEKYLVGEAKLTETVENIEIDWHVGSVTVKHHSANSVSFFEKSERELAENTKLRYWLDNSTLRIKFCACGKWDFSDMEKDLTVLVPDTLIISNLKVNSLSANVNLSDCAVSNLAKFNTVSGELEAKFTKPLKEFKGDSTSGSFTVSAPSISRLDVGAISGVVSLSAQKEPDWLDVDTTSGDINLVLAESASFTLDFDTTSGDLSSKLSYRRSGGKYIFGDGKGEYKISTISGNVELRHM